VLSKKNVLGLIVAVLVALGLVGCSSIGTDRVSEWPELKIVEHYVPNNEMRDRCARYVGFGMSPLACSEFDFDGKLCHIWYSADFPPQGYIVRHERAHCLGYEHAGEHELQAMLNDYRGAQSASASTGSSK
jgi:hypothetical protein